MSNRQEKARVEEDAWLDMSLADLAELSQGSSASKKFDAKPTADSATLPDPLANAGAGHRSNHDVSLEDRKQEASSTPYSSKA
jgi:hypothetical protein